MWDMEANYFMNYYDPAYQPYVPAYSHPFYGNPAYYIPEYTDAPTYAVSPTPTTPTYTPSNGTFQFNQATDYGSPLIGLTKQTYPTLLGPTNKPLIHMLKL
jgi:hypothetical protein